MQVTVIEVYADASVKGRAGAWGAVIVHPELGVIASGNQLRDWVNSSTEAELYAIANAVSLVWKSGHLAVGVQLRVWCDNASAVLIASGGTKRPRKATQAERYALAMEHLRRIIAESGADVEFLWTKGHSRLKDCQTPEEVERRKRNAQADRIAGKHVDKAFARYREEKKLRGPAKIREDAARPYAASSGFRGRA